MERIILKAGLLFLLCPLVALPQSTEKLSLHDAISVALKVNPEVLRAQKEIDASEGRILQAGRIPNPEFGISWNETPTNFNIRDADERDIGITQQIEFPTKRANRIDVATFDKQIAELQLERLNAILTARVRKAYNSLLFSQEIVESLEEQLKLLRQFLELVNAKLMGGTSSYLDVIRAKVELTRLNNELTEAGREVQIRKIQLNLLLGREGDRSIELLDSLSYVPMTIRKDTLMTLLSEKSSFLRMAQRSVGRQQSALSLARTSFLPDFSVGFFHQRRAEEPPFNANQFTGTTTNSLGVQLGISIPLWFWQEPKGQVHEANALVDIAQLNLRAVEHRVRARVLGALDLVNVAQAQVRVFDTSLLADLKDILATGIAQYRNNQIDVLNLLDVYRTYRAAKVEYARALLNYVNAVADLEAAPELQFEE